MPGKPKRGRGRPRRERGLSTQELKGVCTPEQKEAAKAAAAKAGESLSLFVVTAVGERVERLK